MMGAQCGMSACELSQEGHPCCVGGGVSLSCFSVVATPQHVHHGRVQARLLMCPGFGSLRRMVQGVEIRQFVPAEHSRAFTEVAQGSRIYWHMVQSCGDPTEGSN